MKSSQFRTVKRDARDSTLGKMRCEALVSVSSLLLVVVAFQGGHAQDSGEALALLVRAEDMLIDLKDRYSKISQELVVDFEMDVMGTLNDLQAIVDDKLRGPTGPIGNPGVRGQDGPVGPQGTTGATGPRGDQGRTGRTGPTGSDGAGPPGRQGATGPTGPEGFTGATGYRGYDGRTGATGATGRPGPSG